MKIKLSFFTVIALVFFAFGYANANNTVKVVGVKDGDSIVVLEGNKQTEIRLQCIDAPEMGQAHGKAAKDALSRLVFGKYVTIENAGTDKYGRTLAYVYTVEGVNINEEMVNRGYAWHYDKYCSSAKLKDLQKYAKKEGKGLWVDNNPIPPWDFRQTKKDGSARQDGSAGQAFSNEDLDKYKSRQTTTEPKAPSSSSFSPTPTPPPTSSVNAPSSSKPSASGSGAYVGTVNSSIYHNPSCEWAKKISPHNLVNFDSPEDAKRKGYRPCKVCNPPSN